MSKGRPASDVFQRFLEKVEIRESGCHEWICSVNRGGYGKFYYEGKCNTAHRVSYILFNGKIPDNLFVLHKCDNRICVNPEHLFLGSGKDNIRDMDKKKRRGTKCPLTNSQVDEIREMLRNRYSQQKIAEKFNVGQTVISRIKLGQTVLFKA